MKNNELMKPLPLEEDSDDNVANFEFIGHGRLILNTKYGEIIIDVRHGDVNSFVFEDGKRVDHLLIKPDKQ